VIITVNVKVCRLCGAQYSTSGGSSASSRHYPAMHPGESPAWKTRREQRDQPLTITYLHGRQP
jgi:hypothetical protein